MMEEDMHYIDTVKSSGELGQRDNSGRSKCITSVSVLL
jgi:hypothetical protein